jgi:hypothetical protein
VILEFELRALPLPYNLNCTSDPHPPFFFVVLEMELRALYMLSKSST